MTTDPPEARHPDANGWAKARRASRGAGRGGDRSRRKREQKGGEEKENNESGSDRGAAVQEEPENVSTAQ